MRELAALRQSRWSCAAARALCGGSPPVMTDTTARTDGIPAPVNGYRVSNGGGCQQTLPPRTLLGRRGTEVGVGAAISLPPQGSVARPKLLPGWARPARPCKRSPASQRCASPSTRVPRLWISAPKSRLLSAITRRRDLRSPRKGRELEFLAIIWRPRVSDLAF